jgi:Flp pilus assembly pilin Flp
MIYINAGRSTAAKKRRMAFNPRRASIVEVAGIATAICVALVAYLAYVLISILATA